MSAFTYTLRYHAYENSYAALVYAALYRALGNNTKEFESYEYEGRKSEELMRRIKFAHATEEHRPLLKVRGCYFFT
jgi:hypothetical protein